MVSKVPKHVGLILDGNRRFAKKLGLQPWKGHEFGIKKIEELLKWCLELGVKELTLYSFSTENFNRNKQEIKFLFNLFKKKFEQMKNDSKILKNGVRINLIGRIEMFPADIRKAMLEVAEKTKNNKKLIVNFALAYGGRQEIIDSFKEILKNNPNVNLNKINEELITKNLYLQSEPDLIIRPGGEMRMSNFLLWQSSYAELFFIEKLWPEFTKEDLVNIIKEFNQRQRRFGR